MSLLPVGRITSGVQQHGAYGGTPATTVQILADPNAAWVMQCAAASRVFEDRADYPVIAAPQHEQPMTQLLHQKLVNEQFCLVGEVTMAGLLRSMKPWHVVLSGSEPCDYDMTSLCKELHGCGRRVQIETRGATYREIPANIWLTLKTAPSRDNILDVDVRMLARANEVVAKVYSPDDVDGVDRLVGLLKSDKIGIWIIPGRPEQRLYSMCVDVAAAKRWRVVRPR